MQSVGKTMIEIDRDQLRKKSELRLMCSICYNAIRTFKQP